MDYIELNCIVPDAASSEILMAGLSELGWESFIEQETGFSAYIQEVHFDFTAVKDLQIVKQKQLSFTWKIITEQNWNQVWESQYDPVIIDNICTIRAPFHQLQSKTKYEIVIEPKMSFGTGHHETTSMMIQLLGDINVKNLSVLDMGCGTGVLAILAFKMGAGFVTAIDNDEWAYHNCLENIGKNSAATIKVIRADASVLSGMPQTFDIVMANINRNILLQDMEKYSFALKSKGTLMLSGFYRNDHSSILECAEQFSLKESCALIKNDWMALQLNRIE